MQGGAPGTHPLGWVQARGVLGPYVVVPRERANPPQADRWAFFSSLLDPQRPARSS
jgi:hypothetical protein